jgi:hypothetical protein
MVNDIIYLTRSVQQGKRSSVKVLPGIAVDQGHAMTILFHDGSDRRDE